MSYVVLAGPSVAQVTSDTRYFALVNTTYNGQPSISACVSIDRRTKTQLLTLGVTTPAADLVQFVNNIARQYKGQAIVAEASDAIAMAAALQTVLNEGPSQAVLGLDVILEASSYAQIGGQTLNNIRFDAQMIKDLNLDGFGLYESNEITLSITSK